VNTDEYFSQQLHLFVLSFSLADKWACKQYLVHVGHVSVYNAIAELNVVCTILNLLEYKQRISSSY